MQHGSRFCPESSKFSFSTLYGSKWVATPTVSGIWRMEIVFQYPLRVEVGCNYLAGRLTMKSLGVSVPSTGRSGLQRRKQSCASCSALRFSTLYGSKWVATTLRLPAAIAGVGFQYPLRVEVGCNSFRACGGTNWLTVSVPSTGRSGLQRVLGISFRNNVIGFSTLYGSKWVATSLVIYCT